MIVGMKTVKILGLKTVNNGKNGNIIDGVKKTKRPKLLNL